MPPNHTIEVKNLVRHFGKTKAVDDISFSFRSGHVFGFVGPNGAGKTTTLRIIATLDEPTGGDVLVNGVSAVENPEAVRRMVGFVPDSLPTHADITVHEYLDFFARAYGLDRRLRSRAVAGVKEFTKLTAIQDKLLKALSKGMKQRVSLARALVHDPGILVMDEPASGLDPRARVEFRELVSVLADMGKSILISSHILTELTEICNGVVIIERGKILATGGMDEILARIAPDSGPVCTVAVRVAGDPDALARGLLEMPGVTQVRPMGKEVHADVAGDETAAAGLLRELIRRDFNIVEFRPLHEDLEDIFMKVTKGDIQ